MSNRVLFNETVSNYDKYRPTYCSELFETIIGYSALESDMNILEIGCGTGQATKPFLVYGCRLKAVELGKDLAAYTEYKFKDYSKFFVECCSFENYEDDDESYDLIFSATAFHWIEPKEGYDKAFKLLRSGGCISLFWNKPIISRGNTSLFNEIQDAYRRHVPSWSNKVNSKISAYAECVDWMKRVGFENIKSFNYRNKRSLTGSEYIELLNTYSDHIALSEDVKDALYSEIVKSIRKYNDKIVIDDNMELYLGMKL